MSVFQTTSSASYGSHFAWASPQTQQPPASARKSQLAERASFVQSQEAFPWLAKSSTQQGKAYGLAAKKTDRELAPWDKGGDSRVKTAPPKARAQAPWERSDAKPTGLKHVKIEKERADAVPALAKPEKDDRTARAKYFADQRADQRKSRDSAVHLGNGKAAGSHSLSGRATARSHQTVEKQTQHVANGSKPKAQPRTAEPTGRQKTPGGGIIMSDTIRFRGKEATLNKRDRLPVEWVKA